LKLGATVVLPMIIGVIFQIALKKVVAFLKSKLNFSIFNQCVLLFVIYCVFCDIFVSKNDFQLVSFFLFSFPFFFSPKLIN